jgi:hypothetical protein
VDTGDGGVCCSRSSFWLVWSMAVDVGGRPFGVVSWSWLVAVSARGGLLVMSWWSCFPCPPSMRMDKSWGFSTPGESFACHSLPSRQCQNPRVPITSLEVLGGFLSHRAGQ